MECCLCDKELDDTKDDSYEYDYMGNAWCKECMDKEVNREM